MTLRSLPRQGSLAASSRVGVVAERLGTHPLAEAAVLAFLGVTAAWLTFQVDLPVRVPGHAILKGALPLALGFALVPRTFAGCVMGGSALAAVLLQGQATGAPGWGSTASLVLFGPTLDLVASRVRSGRGLYAALLAAGLLANTAAFGVRLGAKLLVHDGTRPLATWWPEAIVSYAACGAAAGLVSAGVWFRFSRR